MALIFIISYVTLGNGFNVNCGQGICSKINRYEHRNQSLPSDFAIVNLYPRRRSGNDENVIKLFSMHLDDNQSDNDNDKTSSTKRREFIHNMISSSMISSIALSKISQVQAMEQDDGIPTITTTSSTSRKKPFAPLSALLPAARVKSTIDDALNLTNEIITLDKDSRSNNNDETKNGKKERIAKLEEMIIQREQNGFMNPFPGEIAPSSSLITKTSMPKSNSKLNEESYKERMKNIPMRDRPFSLLTEAGEKRQFEILQSRQRRLEQGSPIREALNFYTRQLQFNTESYVLNASAEERKRMIRNDALPDVKSVIVSDLDLRDLTRNQILDAYDDVRAEMLYQLRNKNGNNDDGREDFDATELKVLLLRAQKECNQWFSFIDEKDVQEAMDAVAREM